MLERFDKYKIIEMLLKCLNVNKELIVGMFVSFISMLLYLAQVE